jgi:Bax protein
MSPTQKPLSLPLLLLIGIVGCAQSPPSETEIDGAPTPVPAAVEPAPAAQPVPDKQQAPRAPTDTQPLPDFSTISDVPTLKRTFYAYLRPMVLVENDRIRAQRQRLQQVRQRHDRKENLSTEQIDWLADLATEYRLNLDGGPIDTAHLDRLGDRVDIVPAALALAQAAIESGWGRSRFARLGNNIYGEWCFTPGCGIVPQDRNPGATHEIADFDTPAGSIASYLRNLNTHTAYAELRVLRRQQRDAGIPLDAHELAAGLTAYSELREVYVQRVRDVIRQNAALIPPPPASVIEP